MRKLALMCSGAVALAAFAAQAEETVTYTYDALGRLVEVDHFQGPADNNGLVVKYSYDPAGNRTQEKIDLPANQPPTASNDSQVTDQNTPITFDPRGNDTDPNGNASLFVSAVTQPAHGTATFSARAVTYTPANGYLGADSFTYTVADGRGGSSIASVAITVRPPNVAPTAVADTPSVGKNKTLTFNPRANDTDPNGDPLVITAVSAPAHGTVSFTSTAVTYTPSTGYAGTDGFTYTISDGRNGASTANITMTVANTAPVAVSDTATLKEGSGTTRLYVLDNDSDADGDPLKITSASGAAHGYLSNQVNHVTYTVVSGYVGADSFTYTVADDTGATATATVNVMVRGLPVARDDSQATANTTMLTFDPRANDSDPDNDPLTITSIGQYGSVVPTGTLVINSGTSVTYTPKPGFQGYDWFTYQVSDGREGSRTANIQILVHNPPVAAGDNVTATKNTAVTFDPRGNDTGAQALTVTGVSAPAHGTATFTGTSITYTPATGYVGTDSFTYTVSDGHGGTASATVSATVISQSPPTAVADPKSTFANTPVTFDPRANDTDPDNDPLTVTGVSTPAHGTATYTATSVTYTPAQNYSGADSFTYTISDGRGGTATGTVNMTVQPQANQAPIAQNDSFYLVTSDNLGMTYWANVLSNDSDPNGDPLTITSVTDPAGTTSTSIDGSRIKVTAMKVGITTFSYTISDGRGGTATATVTIQRDYESGN